MGRTTTQMQAALLRARRRRVELERERDQRVEEAAAQVLVLLPQTAAARERLRHLEQATGTALQRLLDEGLTPAQAGELCELEARQVRRLLRARTTSDPAGGNSEGTGDSDASGEDAGDEAGGGAGDGVSPPPLDDATPSVG